MKQTILLEDTPPRRRRELDIPLALFLAAAVWAVGAAILHLTLRPL